MKKLKKKTIINKTFSIHINTIYGKFHYGVVFKRNIIRKVKLLPFWFALAPKWHHWWRIKDGDEGETLIHLFHLSHVDCLDCWPGPLSLSSSSLSSFHKAIADISQWSLINAYKRNLFQQMFKMIITSWQWLSSACFSSSCFSAFSSDRPGSLNPSMWWWWWWGGHWMIFLNMIDELIYFRTPEEGSQVPQLTCSQMRRGSCLDLDEVNTAV